MAINSIPNKNPYVIGRVYIDNFEDLSSSRDSKALSNIDTVIFDTLDAYGAVLTKGTMGRYTIYIEYDNLQMLIQNNFSILDKARDVKTQNGVETTLSIAVGVSNISLKEASHACYQAMELVLGRGGDQAIVKSDEQFYFYGGKFLPHEKYSQVKVRVFAKSLRKLMEQYDRILVCGHAMADYDSLGAIIGIAECAFSMEKETHILIDDDRLSIEKIYELLTNDKKWSQAIVNAAQAGRLCDARTMLIICDTQRQDSLSLPSLVDTAGAVAIIDHHRRSVESISPTLDFIHVSASSTCEIVSEIINYFSYSVEISSIAATALFCGILVDTKNFAVNVSSRTFESAAYLRKKGADSYMIQSIFQDRFEYFLVRSAIIKKTEFPFENIAVSAYKGKHDRLQVLAAQACDQLIAMKDIRAAFAITKKGKTVYISARSSSDFNCQRVMELLGGGGHFNVAGVQKDNIDIDQAEEMLFSAIGKYIVGDLEK